MFDKLLKVRIEVEFEGECLHLDKVVSELTLEDIIPSKYPAMDPGDLFRRQETLERRRRFVDMLSGNIAHSITEGLFKLRDR